MPKDIVQDHRRLGVRASDLVITLLLSVSLFVGFVVLYFFIITAKVEAASVKTNTDRAIKALANDLNLILNDEDRPIIQDAFASLEAPDLFEEDEKIRKSNESLFRESIQLALMVVIGSAIAIVVIYVLGRGLSNASGRAGEDYPHIWKLIAEGLIVIGFIILTELIFLFVILANYRSLDPNALRLKLVQVFRNFISE